MSTVVQIDELDVKILNRLLEDARASLRSIAKDCGLTSSAVLGRIRRLKQEGVIAGTRLMVAGEAFGHPFYATVLVEASDSQEPQIKQRIRSMQNVIICAESIGRYNLCTLIRGQDINELNKVTSLIRSIKGIRRVATNIWIGKPYFHYGKDLKPTKREADTYGRN
jgi:DNA-binding Lrp family transcriptional regulator